MRSVLVTGAYGGMGKSTVEHLKENGYRVFALDLRAVEPMDNVIPVVADITSEESVREAFERVSEMTDSLFAVVHFAGIYMLDSLAEMKNDDFQRILNVNLYGAFLVNKTFFPLLSRNSRIIITTSELATLDPLPFTGIYAVTKAALDKYAYSLAMEAQLLGVRVSVLRAGAVNTGMLNVSTDYLDRFCENTRLYSCNAKRFKAIVGRVEARSISPERIAKKCTCILKRRNPRFAYSINRNPLLCLLDILPKRFQLFVIKLILK